MDFSRHDPCLGDVISTASSTAPSSGSRRKRRSRCLHGARAAAMRRRRQCRAQHRRAGRRGDPGAGRRGHGRRRLADAWRPWRRDWRSLDQQRGRPTICQDPLHRRSQQVLRVDEESMHALDAEESGRLIAAARLRAAGGRRRDPVRLRQGMLLDGVPPRDRTGREARHPGLCRSEEPRFRALSRRQRHHPQLQGVGSRGASAGPPMMPRSSPPRPKVIADRRRRRSSCTRSRKGHGVVEAYGAVHIEPARAREVFDVRAPAIR